MGFLTYTKHYYGDHIKENETGRACSMHDRTLVGNYEGRDHLVYPGADGRTILK